MNLSSEMLASRVRRLRIAKGLSIEQMAIMSDIYKNTIVRIEKGGGRPSLKSLISICSALEVTVDKLIDMKAHVNKDFFVYRRDKENIKKKDLKSEQGLCIGDLSAKLPFGIINAVIIEISDLGKVRSHPGEELLFCLKGKVGIKIGSTEVILEKGDSVLFYGREPHQYFNADTGKNPVAEIGLSIWMDQDIDLESDYAEAYHL